MSLKKYGWIALVVLAADQLVKALARGLTEPVTLLPGVLALTYAENTGMAFSLLSGQPALLGVLSLGAIVLAVAALRRYRLGALAGVAAMLALGGAAGNMIDRLFQGYVVDMFEVLLFRFAIFNVADAALTVGCILLAGSLLFQKDEWSEMDHGSK